MKTAMQELMEWFYNRPQYDKTSEGYEIMVMAELLLQVEKEQICNSYVEGLEGLYMEAEEYYNKTYN
jgi:hypothetical protein